MNFLKQTWEQVIAIWQKLERKQKVAFILSLGTFVVALCFFISWATRPEYSLLYSGLSFEDAGQIIDKLKEQKIPYKLKDGGRTILVPTSQVYETRINLAMEGIPRGGQMGFEIFDNTGLIGMTNFMERINYQRALQGELARTIESLEEIQRARVHLVLPEESPFIGEKSKPRASVVVLLKQGRYLRKDQVLGIAKLISGSVSDLELENVTVVNQKGEVLFGGEETSSPVYLTANQIDTKKQVEEYLAGKVRTLLSSVLGPDRVVVKVDARLNFDQITRTEEYYDPESRVVLSEIRREESSEKTETPIGGSPGAKTNLGQGTLLTSGNPGKETREETSVQYAINKKVEQIVEGVGNIERISVAVAVDGTYKKTPEGKMEYIPLSNDEIEKLTSMVKQAVGYDESRGDTVTVTNVPFDTSFRLEETGLGGIPLLELMRHLGKYIVVATISLVLLFSLRQVIKILSGQVRGEIIPGAEKTGKILPVEDEKWLRERVFELADSEPQKVAQIIKIWITNHGRA